MTVAVQPDSPRARGRRIAVRVYYLLLAAVCLMAGGQVTRELLFARAPERTPVSSATCAHGLRALIAAVTRAKVAANTSALGEDHALNSFRAALEPEWGRAAEVSASCSGSVRDEAALDAIFHLRYAEENAVRREAAESYPFAVEAQALMEGELVSETATGRPARPPRTEPGADPAGQSSTR